MKALTMEAEVDPMIINLLTLARLGPSKSSIIVRIGLSKEEVEEYIHNLSKERLITVMNSMAEEMVYITDRGLKHLRTLLKAQSKGRAT